MERNTCEFCSHQEGADIVQRAHEEFRKVMERALESLDKQTDTMKRSRTDGAKSADPGTSSSAAASSLGEKRGRWQLREAPQQPQQPKTDSAEEQLRKEDREFDKQRSATGQDREPVPKWK